MHSALDQAIAYLDTLPAAISWSNGHNKTFLAACAVVLGFDLDGDDALAAMEHYNRRSQPAWSRKELLHKLAGARKQHEPRGRGYLLVKDLPSAAGTVLQRIGIYEAWMLADADLCRLLDSGMSEAEAFEKVERAAILLADGISEAQTSAARGTHRAMGLSRTPCPPWPPSAVLSPEQVLANVREELDGWP